MFLTSVSSTWHTGVCVCVFVCACVCVLAWHYDVVWVTHHYSDAVASTCRQRRSTAKPSTHQTGLCGFGWRRSTKGCDPGGRRAVVFGWSAQVCQRELQSVLLCLLCVIFHFSASFSSVNKALPIRQNRLFIAKTFLLVQFFNFLIQTTCCSLISPQPRVKLIFTSISVCRWAG